MSYSAWPAEVDDRALLEAINRGDFNACWSLWQRHAAHLYGVCLGEMKGQKADAEDALAQSMLKAVTKLPTFAGNIACARAWLRQLTRNVCKDIQRETSRSRRIAECARAIKDEGYRTTNELDAGDDARACDPTALLERLPPRLKEPFALRVLEQLRYEEIARRLQLTCVTARKRVQQARKLLQASRHEQLPARNVTPHAAAPSGTDAESTRQAVPAVARTVRVHLSSGREAEVEILLDHRPLRESQKINTLRTYVNRHPRGWKKRLALANLLYETGAWSEAVDAYQYVLAKRPWLTTVSARLEEMSSKLEKFT